MKQLAALYNHSQLEEERNPRKYQDERFPEANTGDFGTYASYGHLFSVISEVVAQTKGEYRKKDLEQFIDQLNTYRKESGEFSDLVHDNFVWYSQASQPMVSYLMKQNISSEKILELGTYIFGHSCDNHLNRLIEYNK